MNENIKNIRIDEVLEELFYLREENKQLKANNRIIGDELTYFKEYSVDLEDKINRQDRMIEGIKLNNSKLTLERNDLLKQVSDLKRKYDEFYEKEYLVRIEECNKLWGELFDIKHLSMWEFANKYCTEEEQAQAGKQLARELLGGA
jgi:predicted nuclease with TOPRIM domain